jgi:hypothetical protein
MFSIYWPRNSTDVTCRLQTLPTLIDRNIFKNSWNEKKIAAILPPC